MRKQTEEERILVRTLLNLSICVVDFFPGIGLAVPLLADVAKFARRLDLTPDVPKKVAFGFLIFDIPTIGIFPSYFVPTVWQLGKDLSVLFRSVNKRKARRSMG